MIGTIYRMALNIKDPEVDELAAELARRMGHTNKTQAIRDALRAQLAVVASRATDRSARLLDVMHSEIWPMLPSAAPLTKEERNAILGYDQATGV